MAERTWEDFPGGACLALPIPASGSAPLRTLRVRACGHDARGGQDALGSSIRLRGCWLLGSLPRSVGRSPPALRPGFSARWHRTWAPGSPDAPLPASGRLRPDLSAASNQALRTWSARQAPGHAPSALGGAPASSTVGLNPRTGAESRRLPPVLDSGFSACLEENPRLLGSRREPRLQVREPRMPGTGQKQLLTPWPQRRGRLRACRRHGAGAAGTDSEGAGENRHLLSAFCVQVRAPPCASPGVSCGH